MWNINTLRYERIGHDFAADIFFYIISFQISQNFVSKGPNYHLLSIGVSNGLVYNMQEANAWSNIDQVEMSNIIWQH